MQDDLSSDLRIAGDGLADKLHELSKYHIDTREVQQWAYKRLRFLTFDDTDIRTQGYDSDDDDGMLDFAIKFSRSENQGESPTIQAGEGVGKGHCTYCLDAPMFPVHRTTRKFRIVSPEDVVPMIPGENKSVDICRHYVAISYCWPKDDRGNPKQSEHTYQVRELDGTLRRARAPNYILDRAVDIAIELGLRFIWIDQECLTQDDNDEYHRVGVQAMDIVYNRARFTAALLDVEIASQEEINALVSLATGRSSDLDLMVANAFPIAMRLIDRINRDNWNTRAWILQESFSAGNGLILSLQSRPGVNFAPKFGFDESQDVMAPYDQSRRLPSTNICVPTQMLRSAAKAAQALSLQYFTAYRGMLMHDYTASPTTVQAILTRYASLFPEVASPKSLEKSFYSLGMASYGMRQTCDAATAMSLLADRKCLKPQDRVAILGNLCNYETRMDSVRMADRCSSLKLAILALALSNGDCSLLAPELYYSQLPNDTFEHQSGSDASWLSPFDRRATSISSTQIYHGKHATPTAYPHNRDSLSGPGLRLRAYLWSIDRKVSPEPIKKAWAQQWHHLKCITMDAVRQHDETQEAFNGRVDAAVQKYAQTTEMQSVLEEIWSKQQASSSCHAGGSAGHTVRHERNTVVRDGIHITAHVNAHRVLREPEMQRIVSDILFSILGFLYCEGETALANAIWHSIRTDCTFAEQGMVVDDVPDNVSDWVLDPTTVCKNTWKLLQLDIARGGTFEQAWLVERIMLDGFLWAARYASLSENDQTGPDEERSEVAPWDPNDHAMQDLWTKTTGLPYFTISDTFGVASKFGTAGYKIIQRQAVIRATMQFMSGANISEDQSADYVTSRAIMAIKDTADRRLLTHAAESFRKKHLAATFDVNRPCYVAVPFNYDWEWLPHPPVRTMSVCWSVDIGDAEIATEQREGLGDMTQAEMRSDQAITDAATDSQDSSYPQKGKNKASDEYGPHAKGIDHNLPDEVLPLRIVGKVRGFWALMDLPQHEYIFF